MAIKSDQIVVTMKEIMLAVKEAQAGGIPFRAPGSLLFSFPVDLDGATVEFEVAMDWYAITKDEEDVLWKKVG